MIEKTIQMKSDIHFSFILQQGEFGVQSSGKLSWTRESTTPHLSRLSQNYQKVLHSTLAWFIQTLWYYECSNCAINEWPLSSSSEYMFVATYLSISRSNEYSWIVPQSCAYFHVFTPLDLTVGWFGWMVGLWKVMEAYTKLRF